MKELDYQRVLPGFQPIIDIARGAVVGHEVLARERLDDGSLISLGDLFYETPGHSRALLQLDRHIRSMAVDQLKTHPHGFISLNISPDWISQLTAWTTTPLLQMLQRSGIDPSRVIIEITEQKGTVETIRRVVERYREEGYRVAIDDFGAGNSHMHRIMELEPDILKLDMKLFKQAANSGKHYDLVHSVSALAEKTGCQLVCEGVETAREFEFGLELGASWMQGYLFSPAQAEFLPPDAYGEQISALRTQFLENKIAHHKQQLNFDQNTEQVLMKLVAACRSKDHWSDITLPADSNVLKFYLCSSDGTQISDNYEVTPQGIVSNNSVLGTNWCWRPHFYQLLASRETSDQQFVSSDYYRDIQMKQLCRSYVTRLQHNQYLFVDVLQPEES
ncbi:EAL domain-containing protein [Salinispirillum sp. LH 10-3-1]|uniref:EAL domain-containing protein n=1 Tax=Salinispirillum sp. LH 10-3-1 TaxID=2952525 RepID=A0AB38YCQ9_9GAMM